MLVVAITGLAMGGDVWVYRMWRLSAYYTGLTHSMRSDERCYRKAEAAAPDEAQRVEKIAAQSFAVTASAGEALNGVHAARPDAGGLAVL
jgi:hypothetical protein